MNMDIYGITAAAFKALLFGIIVTLLLLLYQIIIEEQRPRKSLEKAYGRINRQNEERTRQSDVKKILYGETDKEDLFSSLSALLAYSGLRGRLPWMNPFLYCIGVSCLVLAAFAAAWTLTGQVVYGLAAMAAGALLPYGILTLLQDGNYRKTEKCIIPFMNLVENFSFSSDDLLEILERAGQMVEDPIRREVAGAVLQARRSGDTLLAIRLLRENMEYPHFKRLIGNLERCSRGTADYKGIIAGSRGTVERNLAHGKEIKELHKNGRGEILLMIGMGAVLVPFMGSVNGTEENVFRMMWQALAGRCILVALAAIVAAALWFCAFGIKRRK